MPEPVLRNIETPQMAEHVAMEWMRHWGFHDAKVTPPGPDAGLDVVSHGAVAQVKFYSAQIGRKTLQELVGANHGSSRQMIFFTTSGYSKPAHEYADKAAIALFKIGPFGKAQPENTAAERLAAREEVRRREREEQRKRNAAMREEARRQRKREEQRKRNAATPEEAGRQPEKARAERRSTDEETFDRWFERSLIQGRPADGANRPADKVHRDDRHWKAADRRVDRVDPTADLPLGGSVLVVLICTLVSGLLPRAIGWVLDDGFHGWAVVTLPIGGVAALLAGCFYLGGVAANVARVGWCFGGGLLGAAAIGWWAFADGAGEVATKVLAVLVGLAWLVGFAVPANPEKA